MASHVEQMIEGPDGARQRVLVHLGESPLSWLRARGRLSERHFVAGDTLRADWERAGLGARVTMRWDAAPTTGGRRGPGRAIDPTLTQMAARERAHDASSRAASHRYMRHRTAESSES